MSDPSLLAPPLSTPRSGTRQSLYDTLGRGETRYQRGRNCTSVQLRPRPLVTRVTRRSKRGLGVFMEIFFEP